MPERIPKENQPSHEFKMEFCRISTRIRKAMVQLVPDDWRIAAMVVRETDPKSDELIEIEGPLYNQENAETIEPASNELMQSLEDMYLLFYPDERPWEACEISLEKISSNKNRLRTKFHYPEKDDPGSSNPPF